MTILHLGCGLDYRPNAVNVDRYDLTVTDVQADVLRLPLAQGTAAHVEARHVVEHLGYAGTIYALAEWLRVLKAGGTLLVETPDRRSACLAAADAAPPAPVLHWLFGLPWAGYMHRALFSEQELRSIASQAGWKEIEITRIESPERTASGSPHSLCLTAHRPADPLAELRAWLHIGFAEANVLDPFEAPPYLAHVETICDRVVFAVERLSKQDTRACLATVLGATARYDPRLTRVTVEVLVSRRFVDRAFAEPFLALATSLTEAAFPARMAARLRQSPALPGTQDVRLKRLQEEVSLYLAGRLHPEEEELRPSREWFEAADTPPEETDREVSFFCQEAVSELSRRETARGVRAFAQQLPELAARHFTMAIAYDADNPLPFWNLARLAISKGRRLEALEQYAALLELLPEAVELVRHELDAATQRSVADTSRVMGPVQLDRASTKFSPAGYGPQL